MFIITKLEIVCLLLQNYKLYVYNKKNKHKSQIKFSEKRQEFTISNLINSFNLSKQFAKFM